MRLAARTRRRLSRRARLLRSGGQQTAFFCTVLSRLLITPSKVYEAFIPLDRRRVGAVFGPRVHVGEGMPAAAVAESPPRRWRQLCLPWAPLSSLSDSSLHSMPGHGHPELAELEELLSHHSWQPAAADKDLWLRLSRLLVLIPLKTFLVVPESLEDACCTEAVRVRLQDSCRWPSWQEDTVEREDALIAWADMIALDQAGLDPSTRDASVCDFARNLSLENGDQVDFLLRAFLGEEVTEFVRHAAAERLGCAVAEARLRCLPSLVRGYLVDDRRDMEEIDGEMGAGAFAVLHGWARGRQPRKGSLNEAGILRDVFAACMPRARDVADSQFDGGSMGTLLAELQLDPAQAGALFSQLSLDESSRPKHDSYLNRYGTLRFKGKLLDVSADGRSAAEICRAILDCLLDEGAQQGLSSAAPFAHTLMLFSQWAMATRLESWPAARRAELLRLWTEAVVAEDACEWRREMNWAEGKPFWRHAQTGETRWEPPPLGGDSVGATDQVVVTLHDDDLSIEALTRAAQTSWRGAAVAQARRTASLLGVLTAAGVDRIQCAKRKADMSRSEWVDAVVEEQLRYLDADEARRRFGVGAFETSSDGLLGRYRSIDEEFCHHAITQEVTNLVACNEIIDGLTKAQRFPLPVEDASRLGRLISELGLEANDAVQVFAAVAATEAQIFADEYGAPWVEACDFTFAAAILRAWAEAVEFVPLRPRLTPVATMPPSLLCLSASAVLASNGALPPHVHLPECEAKLCLDALVHAAKASWRQDARDELERRLSAQRAAKRARAEQEEAHRKLCRMLGKSPSDVSCACGKVFNSSGAMQDHLRDSGKCPVAVAKRRAAARVEHALGV